MYSGRKNDSLILHWGPGVRTCYILHYVIKGQGTFVCKGKAYSISVGESFLIRPFEKIEYYANKNDPWSYVWLNFNGGEWRPTKHNLFPKEFTEGHAMAANCSIFKDPLSAIVTVEDDGHIKIEGMETDYMYGVAPEMYGGPFKGDGYGICEPRISSGEYYLLKK